MERRHSCRRRPCPSHSVSVKIRVIRGKSVFLNPPAHYAHHLSRRVRGLPLWFSLATHGTDAYRDSVEQTLALTRETADEIRRRDGLELILEPDLSVAASVAAQSRRV